MGRRVTRRTVFRAGGSGMVAGMLVTGCDALSTEPSKKKDTGDGGAAGDGGGGSERKEAPMLAKMVEEGELPSVDKRLPEAPLVVQPVDRNGTYGGEWQLSDLRSGAASGQGQDIIAGYENLVRWAPDFKEIIPNLADSWTISSDSKEYTFKLHPGVKWSDGESFTADDVKFAVDDVAMNEELNPIPPFGAGAITAEKIDRYTVRLSFAKGNGLFLINLASERGNALTDYPKHYLKEFHKKYNPDVDGLVEKENFEDWVELFGQKSGSYSFGTNTDKPSLKQWVLQRNTKTELVVERNPYYWKADPNGGQLPYLDHIVWRYVSNEEAGLLKIANGEVDYAGADPADKPVLARSRGKGDYRFFDRVPATGNEVCVYLNLADEDPVRRETFQNKDFRVGLSYAINRKEIIDTVYQRQGEPWQVAPREEADLFDEEMAKQYIEYDVRRANEHLDKAYPEKSASGVRLGPDGEPISFPIDCRTDNTAWLDTAGLIVKYWREVGVDASVHSVSASLEVARGEANKHHAMVYAVEGGLDAIILINPFNYIPSNPPYCFFGVPWAEWGESDGKEGEEPPENVKRQLELYEQVKVTSDQDKQKELMGQVLQLVKEEFVGFGIVKPSSAYGVVSNRTQNFPEYHVSGSVWVYMDPGATNTCQYFIKKQ